MDLIKATATFFNSSAVITDQRQDTPITRITGKDSSTNLSTLLLILTGVVFLHVFGIRCFYCLDELKESLAKPMTMEVSTIKIPSAKPENAALPPPPAAAKPSRKKPQPKPKLKKVVSPEPDSAFATKEQVLEQQPLDKNSLPDFSAPDSSSVTTPEVPPYTEAHLDAAYDRNPKPDYPGIARIRGWEGKVILRVQISEEGKVESVEIEKSSRHDLLDESALEAVKQWLFVPAMQGNQPIASSVLVPIIFTLQDQE